MNQTAVSKNIWAMSALKLVMAAVVGIFVNMGQYGAAAFVACLFIDAALPAK